LQAAIKNPLSYLLLVQVNGNNLKKSKMKNLYLTLCLLVGVISATWAQDINPQLNNFMAAYGQDDMAGMEKAANNILQIAPDNYAGYAFKGYISILKNDMANASKYMDVAASLNPVDQGSYGIASYIQFINGNTPEAEKLMNYSFQVSGADGLENTTLDDISQIERFTKKDLSGLKTITKNANTATKNAVANMQKFYGCVNQYYSGSNCTDEASVKTYFNSQNPKNPMAVAILGYYKGLGYYNNGKFEEAKPILDKFVNDATIVSNKDKGYTVAQAYFYLSFYDDYNANTLYVNATKGLEALKTIPFTTLLKCQLLHRKSIAEGSLGKPKEQLVTAQQLLVEAKKVDFPFMEAQANNTIGGYYVMSALSADRLKAATYLSNAYSQAKSTGDANLINQVAGNYAISLWQQGKKGDAINVANNSFETSISNKDYTGAQLMANNLGFMSFMQNDFTNAAKLFRKSVDITEKYRKNLTASQQLAVMNEHTSAYGGLIMSLQKTNNISELFEVQDLNRSRLLRDKLDKNAKPKSLVETQKMLKPEEALLYYSEAGNGEIIVTVITNDNASIGYSFPIKKWLELKKKYVNRLTKTPNSINGYVAKMNQEIVDGQIVHYQDEAQGFKAEDYEKVVKITRDLLNSTEENLKLIQEEILKVWYNHLITPILPKLVGKSKLIISGEGSLNYLPFEAFIDPNGKYLIESFDVKYIPSVTVWATLQNRNYSDNRKSLLAMGGATYQDPNKKGGDVRSINSLFELQDNISEKINKKYQNLTTELKALGFGGANYLPGTLKEVQNLKVIVSDATLLVDGQMKESDIKKMNASGELANYKWVHIATHGFAMDNIPELSGVMMTQPNGGDGAEDTFLLAHEIATLNLKADLAVLSACETALGKVYGGEGINGLNSALLTAGANNTLLSLWPVNDSGTMIMMTVLYDYMYNKKLPVEEAVNKTKRDILNGLYGEQYQNPSIWAPFVLNGK
jgi:CHAT domain-containing protein